MEIRYIGHSSFLIKTKTARIVTDPYDGKKIGLKFPKTEADIVTISHHHPDHDYLAGIAGNPLVLDWPGEFEKMNVRIFGYQSYHDKEKGAERGENILYKIEAEGISILHCGDWGVVPDDNFIESLGDVDVLLIPVGGHFTIDDREAVKIVQKIEPAIVIPMHYAAENLSPSLLEKLSPITDFLKQMGIENLPPQDKLVVKPEDLNREGTKVVVMKSEA